MSSHMEFDESHANVAGGYAQALVLLASRAVIMHIQPGRSKKTIRRLFSTAPRGPLVADKYRGGYAFTGEYQTCLARITRHLESLAVRFGVESPECVPYRMFDAIRRDSKVAGLEITQMVGGPNVFACDTGRVANNPEARAYADGQRAALEGEGQSGGARIRGGARVRRGEPQGGPAACCAPCPTCLRSFTTRA